MELLDHRALLLSLVVVAICFYAGLWFALVALHARDRTFALLAAYCVVTASGRAVDLAIVQLDSLPSLLLADRIWAAIPS